MRTTVVIFDSLGQQAVEGSGPGAGWDTWKSSGRTGVTSFPADAGTTVRVRLPLQARAAASLVASRPS